MHNTRLPIAILVAALSLLSAPSFAAGEGWTEDYEAAKAQAAEQGKDMLLDFTGSDWCGWCIKLVNEVFSKDAFKAYADKNLVLVELDFPRNKQKLSEEVKAQNEKLKEAFSIRGYPSIYLTDSKGLPYAKTGYQPGGPEAYIPHLEELRQHKVERDKNLAAAKSVEGLEKAKLLHAAMQAVGDDLAMQHYGTIVDQIKTLDADNKAGLKKHYQLVELAIQQQSEMLEIRKGVRADPQAAIAKIDALIEVEGTKPSTRQQALWFKSQIQMGMLKDKDAAKLTLIKAIEADPESKMAEGLQKVLEKNFGGGV